MIDEVVTCKVLADSGKSANGRRPTGEESKALRVVSHSCLCGGHAAEGEVEWFAWNSRRNGVQWRSE